MPSVRKDFLNFNSVVLFISNDFNKSNKSVYKDLNLLMKNLNDNDIKSFYASLVHHQVYLKKIIY